jgi:uncharacterized GH25 family protein
MRCLFHAGLSLIVLASYGAERCVAHQKWLGPNVFVAEKAPVLVSFDVTWSDQPFTAESGVGDQPIEVIGPNGERIAPWQVFVGKTKTTAEVELSKPGTYRLQAVDSLTYWTRVERDGQQQWLKKPKNEVTGAKITRSDLYWSKAMAYVTVGQPTETPPPHDSEPLDIVLDMHPSKLFVGSEFAMRVVSYGKPVPSAEMKVFGANTTGHEPSQTVQCDK